MLKTQAIVVARWTGIRLMKMYFIFILGIFIGAQVAQCQDKAEKPAALEPERSVALEKLLKEGKSIETYAGGVKTEELLSGLAAALGSDDSDIRYNAMGYLLSENAVEDRRILPFVQKVFKKMLMPNGEVIDRHGGNESWRLTRLLSKYPHVSLVPILLHLLEWERYMREGPHVVTTDAVTLSIRHRVSFFDEMAKAIQRCTKGEIGQLSKDGRLMGRRGVEKLAAEWRAWWEANKPKEE